MRRILWFCGIVAAFTTHAVTASSSEERKSHLATSNAGHAGSRPVSSLHSAQVAKSTLRSTKLPQRPLDQTRISTPEMQSKPSAQQDISADVPADVLLDSDKAELRENRDG